MREEEFLTRIYRQLEIGMPVLIPNRPTDITGIRESGDIVYQIDGGYQKVLSRHELTNVYSRLADDGLKRTDFREIVPRSRTTNVTTIKWILRRFDLARELPDRSWVKNW